MSGTERAETSELASNHRFKIKTKTVELSAGSKVHEPSLLDI